MAVYKASSLVAVFLDTGVLGHATQRSGLREEADACQEWLSRLQEEHGVFVVLPEVADYEMRREFLRNGNMGAILRLDGFGQAVEDRYLPIDTRIWREAARLWAMLRNAGKSTSGPAALDGDALIAAQVFQWCEDYEVPLSSVAVATTNVSDLTRFTNKVGEVLPAVTWREITL